MIIDNWKFTGYKNYESKAYYNKLEIATLEPTIWERIRYWIRFKKAPPDLVIKIDGLPTGDPKFNLIKLEKVK